MKNNLNLMVVKLGRRKTIDKRRDLYFSVIQSGARIVIKFYLTKLFEDRYGIGEDSYLSFAYESGNKHQWYLIIRKREDVINNKQQTSSYKIAKYANNSYRECVITLHPFVFKELKSMEIIKMDDIKYYEEEGIISFSVRKIFKDTELGINEEMIDRIKSYVQ